MTARKRSKKSSGGDVLLHVEGLHSGYGRLPVLHGVDLEIEEGQTAVLLGLNGAGKTTTGLNLCGAMQPWSGTVSFAGEDTTSWGIRQSVARGIVMIPEGRRIFPDLPVEKNLAVGAWTRRRDGDWVKGQREQVYEYFPRLEERRTQHAGTLSGGEQQMLAIGRALMADPRLLIIDEASMGLAPVIVKAVFDIVRRINEDGTTVLMIEQNIAALEVAHVGLIMEQGKIISELRGKDLEDPAEVRKAFLG